MDNNNVVIQVRNLEKCYMLGQYNRKSALKRLSRKSRDSEIPVEHDRLVGDRFWALNGVSFDVRAGEIVGIIGCNGAGKSTLLKILSRITTPSAGEIRIRGRIASMLEVGTGFDGEMTGRENIYLNGAILGMNRAEITEKMDQIIAFSECGDFIDTPVKRYSSGMYVRLAFSVSAFLQSEILVMDEVLAVGDAKFQQKCLGKMGDAAAGEGRTVLFVSHNMNSIRQLCSRCIVLSAGKVIYDGDVDSAIKLYADINDSDTGERDISQAERPEGLMQKLRLDYVRILSGTASEYADENRLFLHVRWTALTDLKDAAVRIIIRELTKDPVGMCYSKECMNMVSGQQYDSVFELDLTGLVPGKYSINLIMGKLIGGNVDNWDCVNDAITFTKYSRKDDDAILWTKRTWGAINFNRIKIRELGGK